MTAERKAAMASMERDIRQTINGWSVDRKCSFPLETRESLVTRLMLLYAHRVAELEELLDPLESSSCGEVSEKVEV